MSKQKTSFECNKCGGRQPRWSGQCSHCQAWNSLEEVQERAPASGAAGRHQAWAGTGTGIVKLSQVSSASRPTLDTGIPEFNRVLGGGLMPGSIVMIGGDPGIGKSTLLLQVLANLSKTGEVLYATGEESEQQVHLRAQRLSIADENITLLAEVGLEKILDESIALKPTTLVVDSIQTVYSSLVPSAPGSVSQVRECAAHLTRYGKTNGTTVILVGHVTKDGSLAGPRVLEHIVDTVLYFEGEPGSPFRMVRALKNRFGPANELGVFAMGDAGLEEVTNPSSLFLTAHERPVSGSCIFAALEGTRPFLVEVQALVEDAPTPNAKRSASGFDTNRLQMLLATLHKHAGIVAFDKNVYSKTVGGVKLTEPGADLAVLLAVHSSLTGVPIPAGLVVFGEVGLTGEIRAVADAESRLKEAVKLGFTKALIPSQCSLKKIPEGIDLRRVSRIDQAISVLREYRDQK